MQAAVIGIGAMGFALLKRMLVSSMKVTVFDVNEDRMSLATQAGARAAGSIREAVLAAENIHVFVNSDEQVLDVMLGDGGALASAPPSATVFVHSTIMPATTLALASKAGRVTVIDAPITAVPSRLLDGRAIALIGGDQEAVKSRTPYLRSLGLDVRYFGPLGAGNAAKLAKNFANIGERLALILSVALAERSGLDPAAFLQMVADATDTTAAARWEKMFRVDHGRATVRPINNLFTKDVQQASALAAILDVHPSLFCETAAAASQIAATWNSHA